MNISIISFTKNGMERSQRIKEAWQEAEILLYHKSAGGAEKGSGAFCVEGVKHVEVSVYEWAKEQMEEKNALLFIGACGIAVRAVAPYIKDKLCDSPVLVMDENGRYVIPVLSGHMGGANEIAQTLAEKTGAEAVITTATDIHRQFAADMFAKKNALFIQNKEGIAKVSAKVLAGEAITIAIEPGYWEEGAYLPEGIQKVPYPPEGYADIVVAAKTQKLSAALFLQPREYVIGMGCKRETAEEKIEALIQKTLRELKISVSQIRALVSIDLKREEAGLLRWSKKYGIPFVTYSAEELQSVKGCFRESLFVKEKTGVDNVCERSALRHCREKGELIYEKHAEDGMTIAVAKGKWSVAFDEE